MPPPPDLFARIAHLRASRRPFAVCTVVEVKGSAPRKRGAKMLVFPDGTTEGTIGGGAIEHDITREATQALALDEHRLVQRHLTHELGMCCGGGMSVFIEAQTYPPHLLLFGCGHVGQALAHLAAFAGFDVVAIDPRPDYATPGRFPDLHPDAVRCAHPLDLLPTLPFHPHDTYVVVATHDHDLDEDIVAATLAYPARYLGCIGSQRKALKFQQRLASRGLSPDQIARMRSPMGLPIHALTPQEIAVSVVAELVLLRREQPTPDAP